jgi:hypothetical protein
VRGQFFLVEEDQRRGAEEGRELQNQAVGRDKAHNCDQLTRIMQLEGGQSWTYTHHSYSNLAMPPLNTGLDHLAGFLDVLV